MAGTGAPPDGGLDSEQVTLRAYNLYDTLFEEIRFSTLQSHMTGSIKRLLRRLLRLRLGREPKF